jgi:SAM-dependent methyltransferase
VDDQRWNARYGERDWEPEREPNRFLVEVIGPITARGRALDLACGEGRNAVWLAARGWSVTAVDFSSVALGRARRLAARRGVGVDWVRADVMRFQPAPAAYRLVVILYLQLPWNELRDVLSRANAALAPDGELFLVGHARQNLTQGTGGPRDPSVLWNDAGIERELTALGLRVERAEVVKRPSETPEGPRAALDVLVRARR